MTSSGRRPEARLGCVHPRSSRWRTRPTSVGAEDRAVAVSIGGGERVAAVSRAEGGEETNRQEVPAGKRGILTDEVVFGDRSQRNRRGPGRAPDKVLDGVHGEVAAEAPCPCNPPGTDPAQATHPARQALRGNDPIVVEQAEPKRVGLPSVEVDAPLLGRIGGVRQEARPVPVLVRVRSARGYTTAP
jgi:hypothetical protein